MTKKRKQVMGTTRSDTEAEAILTASIVARKGEERRKKMSEANSKWVLSWCWNSIWITCIGSLVGAAIGAIIMSVVIAGQLALAALIGCPAEIAWLAGPIASIVLAVCAVIGAFAISAQANQEGEDG